ncbi:MAG: formate dehydrogenase accessory sulfurtransferase FdhD [Methanospirillum sp.]
MHTGTGKSTVTGDPAGLTRGVDAIIADETGVRRERAEVSVESTVELRVNGTPLVRLALTRDRLEAFASGFLVCEGVVTSVDAIESVAVDGGVVDARVPDLAGPPPGIELRTSGCPGLAFGLGACREPLPNGHGVELDGLMRAAGLINELARLWRRTGGTHCAVIVGPDGEVIASAEDMGRHTSVDKAVGTALLRGADLSTAILVCTGRLPSGMVAKVYRAGISIVVSNTAPVLAGLELAERLNITVVGFARPPRLTVYTHPERILRDGSALAAAATG